MYTVKRNRGKLPLALQRKFSSYEKARQAVRKFLRTKRSRYFLAFTDAKRTNAAISWGGFSISKA